MKRTIKLSVAVAALAFGVSASAQTYNLSNGWNLVGSSENDVTSSAFSSVGKSLWKFSNGAWQATSPNGSLTSALTAAGLNSESIALDAGIGFWVNANSGPVTTSGTPADVTISLVDGWQLISSTETINVATAFSDATKVTTVWKYSNGDWQAYSPSQTLNGQITSAGITPLSTIQPGEGFWVNASGASDIVTAPPSVSTAYALLEKTNAVPLAGATVYVNGTAVGTTDATGNFDVSSYSDGAKVVLTKSGYAPAYGTVQDGKLVVMTQEDSTVKVSFSPADGNQKPVAKSINSQDGSLQLIVDTIDLTQNVTVSISPYKSTSTAPKLNDLSNVPDENASVLASDMVVIGGGYISVEDSDGNLLIDNNITMDASARQSNMLGELELLLNGQVDAPSVKFQEISAQAFSDINNSINDGTISLYTIQYVDGEWNYVGDAQISKTSKIKKINGSYQSFDKYIIETAQDVVLEKLHPFAFVMKMNAFSGELTFNVKEGGYKMFDGTVVDKNDSNSSVFDWIGDSVVNAVAFGDDGITSGVTQTSTSGQATMTYKVPFATPYATISIKKEGYYDTSVTCEMSAQGAECGDDVVLYKIPDTASVAGYVYEKINGNPTQTGISNALVTLVNPEVLSADKIQTGVDENGTSYVKVGYMPNVTYTWTAMKDDVNVTLKAGTGSTNAMLSENDIYTEILDPYNNNDASDNPVANPAGTWELNVKAVQTFTNTQATLTEEALGSFNIDLQIGKLIEFTTKSLSEKQVDTWVDADGNEVSSPTGLGNAAVYGGLTSGYLYYYGPGVDSIEWSTNVYAAAGGLAVVDNQLVSDTNSSISCADDLYALDISSCYNEVIPDGFKYNKALYPVGYGIKLISDNFANVLEGDPANNNKPFYKSGFTIKSQFKGTITEVQLDEFNVPVEDGNETNTTKVVASYIDLPEDAIDEVQDILDVPSIGLVGASATAYLRQVTTDTDGSYSINMVPVELNEGLKIFAKAEGYKFEADPNFDVKLVDDLSVGVISQYDLYLEPISTEINTSVPVFVSSEPNATTITFDDWNTSVCANTEQSVVWNKLSDPSSVTVNGYISTLSYGDEFTSLMPDSDTNTTGYLWFGSTTTGTFSNTTNNSSSSKVCGSITSPVFDLANYAFPTLDFKTWFEVESVDIAKYMYDQMEVGFIVDDSEGTDGVDVYSIDGNYAQLTPGQYYKIDLLNPDYETSVQSSDVPYSSAGVDAEPKWLDITLPIEQLAGKKVRFVFTFNSKDSLFNGFRGWGVDGVSVKESMKDNLAYPPTMPNIDEVDTAYDLSKILTKTVR